MMTFQDIFKKAFLEGYTATEMSTKTILFSLGVTCLFGLYLFFAYRVLTRKTFYSKSFNIAVAVISVITAAIILTIQTSIVVSLGMVGALSIVRFRTAIKDPMDLIFLFWSISVGIICGAGMAGIALIASILITIGIVVLDFVPVAKAPMLLVVNASDKKGEKAVVEIIKKYTKYYQVKSRTVETEKLDLIIEIRVKNATGLVEEISDLDRILRCSLVSQDGEVTF